MYGYVEMGKCGEVWGCGDVLEMEMRGILRGDIEGVLRDWGVEMWCGLYYTTCKEEGGRGKGRGCAIRDVGDEGRWCVGNGLMLDVM